jgi:cytochrome c551/c552
LKRLGVRWTKTVGCGAGLGPRVLAATMMLAAWTVSGCGGSGASDQEGWVEKGSGRSPLDGGPRAAESPVNEDLALEGEKLFKSKTCSTCHAFGLRVTGPDLAGVTRRRTAAWMEAQIQRPDVMLRQDPISRELLGEYVVPMPNLGIQPREAKALVEYMKKKDRQGV